MEFRWDRKKAASNKRQHGIGFLDAVGVFADPYAIVLEDDSAEEKRYIATGIDSTARVVAVAYVIRGNHIRVISARKATRRERYQYGIQNEKRVRF